MFASPCSLRSAHCATLIALAAAAGIARVDPAVQCARGGYDATNHNVTHRPVVARTSLPDFTATTPTTWLGRIALFAAWWLGKETNDRAASAAERDTSIRTVALPEISSPGAPAGPKGVTSDFHFGRPALCTGAHLLPFAVGPPGRRIHSSLRAVGTEVPGDSSARRSQVTRIVCASFLIHLESATRATGQRPESAGSIRSPSSTLRGELGLLSCHARFRPRVCAPASAGAAPFSI